MPLPLTASLPLLTASVAGTAFLGLPDLLVSSAFLEDPQADPGDRVTVEFTIFNSGPDDAEDVVAGYYLSDDETVSNDDILIDSEETSDIDKGDSEDESEQFAIPSTPDGEYFIIIAADPFDLIAESNENNNTFALPITIGDGDPPACPADLTGDGVLDLEDVQLFVGRFTTGDLAADLNDDGVLDLADVQAYVTGFNAGCP